MGGASATDSRTESGTPTRRWADVAAAVGTVAIGLVASPPIGVAVGAAGPIAREDTEAVDCADADDPAHAPTQAPVAATHTFHTGSRRCTEPSIRFTLAFGNTKPPCEGVASG